MDDDINFDSDGDQEYRYGRQEKRRNFELEDPMEDDDDMHEAKTDRSRNPSHPRRAAAVAGPSRQAVGGEDHEEDNVPSFRPETVQAIFKAVWTDPGTKAQKDAMQLSAEFLRLFTIEALHRTAAYQREQEDEDLRTEETLIELDSLEAITAQLVMDF
ncbi:hypothetical protein BGZ75_005117 [Mortierella antarctica]|nr:hypothetical protein BGZ75_005117 [Mortierella antarctica]